MARLRHAKYGSSPEYDQLRRKADQAWDMAGLARQDGDTKDMQRYTDEAREYERRAAEVWRSLNE